MHILAALVGLALLLVASLYLGSKDLSVGEVTSILMHGPQPSAQSGINAEQSGIIWDLRVPRTLLAVITGAALAMAGAIAQSWTRNPLADPGIIGVNAGASFAVAAALTLGWATTVGERTLVGLVGAAVAALVVLLISRVSHNPLTLVLVGVGVTFALQAATNMLSLYSSDTLEGLRRWTVGSTAGRGMDDVALAALGLALGALCGALAARPLDLLAMGEDSARSLGSSPTRTRLLAAAAVIILAGSATATVGLVTFVGFAVPHLLRPFTGPALTRLLLPTGIVGGAAVLLADIVGRFVLQPNELEMSIVLAIVGAPVMILAVRRKKSLSNSNDSELAI
ncbi:FecCD family ABC transporter permease [Corynebacterium jeikeium]|uniref:FecCD family ABC transporter permease n=1 Tax=Corynebacterium jeikeium TaxID=38289 RepID=UPI000890E912|nr:iron ABC transporter permease [Corynebacterium jeikeium]SCX22853.1 Ferric enterobactin transport system permease protein FepD [Corynebacterium jeikeium]